MLTPITVERMRFCSLSTMPGTTMHTPIRRARPTAGSTISKKARRIFSTPSSPSVSGTCSRSTTWLSARTRAMSSRARRQLITPTRFSFPFTCRMLGLRPWPGVSPVPQSTT